MDDRELEALKGLYYWGTGRLACDRLNEVSVKVNRERVSLLKVVAELESCMGASCGCL